MFDWLRKKVSPISEISYGGRVGLHQVPGVYRVVEVNYSINGEAVIRLLKEDSFDKKYRV